VDWQLFDARRRWETSACVLALAGILFMLAENEVIMSDLAHETQLVSVLVLKSVVAASSAALDVVLVLQYRVTREIRQLQSVKPSTRTKFPVIRRLVFLLELVVCAFHIPPGVTGSIEIRQRYGAWDEDTLSCQTFQRGLEPVLHDDKCYLVYSYPVEALGTLPRSDFIHADK
jgi:hypothetical protein